MVEIPTDLTFHNMDEAIKFANEYIDRCTNFRLTKRSDGMVHLVLLGNPDDDLSDVPTPFC